MRAFCVLLLALSACASVPKSRAERQARLHSCWDELYYAKDELENPQPREDSPYYFRAELERTRRCLQNEKRSTPADRKAIEEELAILEPQLPAFEARLRPPPEPTGEAAAPLIALRADLAKVSALLPQLKKSQLTPAQALDEAREILQRGQASADGMGELRRFGLKSLESARRAADEIGREVNKRCQSLLPYLSPQLFEPDNRCDAGVVRLELEKQAAEKARSVKYQPCDAYPSLRFLRLMNAEKLKPPSNLPADARDRLFDACVKDIEIRFRDGEYVKAAFAFHRLHEREPEADHAEVERQFDARMQPLADATLRREFNGGRLLLGDAREAAKFFRLPFAQELQSDALGSLSAVAARFGSAAPFTRGVLAWVGKEKSLTVPAGPGAIDFTKGKWVEPPPSGFEVGKNCALFVTAPRPRYRLSNVVCTSRQVQTRSGSPITSSTEKTQEWRGRDAQSLRLVTVAEKTTYSQAVTPEFATVSLVSATVTPLVNEDKPRGTKTIGPTGGFEEAVDVAYGHSWRALVERLTKGLDDPTVTGPRRLELCAEGMFNGYLFKGCQEAFVAATGLAANDPAWPWAKPWSKTK